MLKAALGRSWPHACRVVPKILKGSIRDHECSHIPQAAGSNADKCKIQPLLLLAAGLSPVATEADTTARVHLLRA